MVDMLRRGFELVFDEPGPERGGPFGQTIPVPGPGPGPGPREPTPRPFANAFKRLSGDPESMASMPTLQRESLGRRMVLTALKNDGAALPLGFSEEIEKAARTVFGGRRKEPSPPISQERPGAGRGGGRSKEPPRGNENAEGAARRDTAPQLAMGKRPKAIRPEAQREIDAAKRQPGKVLNFRMEESRRWAILNDIPAKFNIKDYPKADGSAPPWRDHRKGVAAVKKHDAIIAREAKLKGVDPDLIRAIMYMENADGNPGGASRGLEYLGIAESILPMQIKPHLWAGLAGVKREEMHKPEANIRASVELLKRIQDRIEDPTPAKIGSIWNFAGRENVSDRGKRIQNVFDERTWNK